jgi:urocanate hydratase
MTGAAPRSFSSIALVGNAARVRSELLRLGVGIDIVTHQTGALDLAGPLTNRGER